MRLKVYFFNDKTFVQNNHCQLIIIIAPSCAVRCIHPTFTRSPTLNYRSPIYSPRSSPLLYSFLFPSHHRHDGTIKHFHLRRHHRLLRPDRSCGQTWIWFHFILFSIGLPPFSTPSQNLKANSIRSNLDRTIFDRKDTQNSLVVHYSSFPDSLSFSHAHH